MGAIIGKELFSISMSGTSAAENLAFSGDVNDLVAMVSVFNDTAATNLGMNSLDVDVEFLTGPNRVQISRNASSDTIEAEVVVLIMDTTKVKVTPFTFSITGNQLDVAFDAFVLAKTWVTAAYQCSLGGGPNDCLVRCITSSTTNVRFTRGASGGTVDGHGWLVEDLGSNWDVQRIENLSVTGLTADATISSVDMTKTMTMCSGSVNSGTNNPTRWGIGFLQASTTFRVERGFDTATFRVDAFIVEFSDTDTFVQRGRVDMGDDQSTETDTTTSVDLTKSFSHIPMRVTGALAIGPGRQQGYAHVEQTSSTEVTLRSNSASGVTISIEWEVINFEPSIDAPDVSLDAVFLGMNF